MKKKLSMLAALALCTTIGGVYATWVYSTNSIPSGYGVANLGIAGVDYVGNAGSISVVGTNTEIKIDDPTNGSDHLTKMTYNPEGFFTVTFTPSATAGETVKDGMDIKWHVGLSNGTEPMSVANFTYEFKEETALQIFTSIDSTPVEVKQTDYVLDANGDPTDVHVITVVEKDGVKSYTFTISMKDVASKLVLNETIKLQSEDRYKAYLTALQKGYIHVHAEVVSGT